jgi:hypothetical protein
MVPSTRVVTKWFSLVTEALLSREPLGLTRHAFAAIGLAFVLWPGALSAQSSSQGEAPANLAAPAAENGPISSSLAPAPNASEEPQSNALSTSTSVGSAPVESSPTAKQTKRILWIFPNYRAVSADTELPPLSLESKFWLSTQDSFDYSSFVTAGLIAGVGQAKNSNREFGEGAKGYGRYYWHAVADQAVGNYLTEAIMPAITHEDPRYYTLGHGGFLKRTGYAFSRLLVTRTDSGGRTFNFSEIVGNGAGAGISDLYYPSRERTWTKTGQKWVTQIGLDGVFNILKEFWPDVNRAVFRGKY